MKYDSKLPSPASALKGIICLLLACMPACGPKEGGSSSSSSSSSSQAGGVAEAPDIPVLNHPASPAEAALAVDLTKFPLMPGVENPGQRSAATLECRIPGDVKSVYEFHKKNLLAQRWKELPGASVTDQYASGMFGRAGFSLSLSVMPASAAGSVDVHINNLSNVELGKLPLPPNTKPVYVGPASAIYTAEGDVTSNKETCRKLLLAAGWEPYGGAGDSAYYKQNAVQLTATVQSAPAEAGKTMITYSALQMSADIPAPPDAEEPRYDDGARKLRFQTAATKEAVAEYYKATLGKKGWKPNEEKLFKIDERDVMAFRHTDGGLLWMDILPAADNKVNVTIKYQTGAELEEESRQIKAMGEAYKAKKEAEEAAQKATGSGKP